MIDDELGLPASAGIATSKVVAKVASSLAKPRGVMLVPAGVERAVLAPLPVRSFPGIGPVAEAQAARRRLRDARRESRKRRPPSCRRSSAPGRRRSCVASQGQGIGDLGRERPAFSEHDPEGETVGSISNERTFREDVPDPASIEAVLCGLCERVCWRARKRGVKARTVTLKLRYADFHTLRARAPCRRPAPSSSFTPSSRRCSPWRARGRLPIRLLGLQLSNLGVFEQLSLFDQHQKVSAVVDGIRERFGFSTVTLATQLGGTGRTLVGRRRSER